MSVSSVWKVALTCCLSVCLWGCGESGPERKETVKVTGTVHVDGQPVENLLVECHDKAGLDKELPTHSTSYTEEDGSFTFSTYEKGDGVPPGSYRLTFKWGEFSLHSMHYGGPDKLNDRYSDAASSKIEFTAEPGEPQDLGVIELTTK